MTVSPANSGSIKLDSAPVTAFPSLTSYSVVSNPNLEAIAAPGYMFSGWTGGVNTAQNPVDVRIDCAIEVQANFVPAPYRAYISHITNGYTEWKDFLQVDNLGGTAAKIQIVLYGSDGSQIYLGEQTTNPFNRSLINLKTLSNNAQSGMVTFSSDQLLLRLSQENLIGGGITEFILPETLGTSLGYFFSDFTPSLQYKGLALTNFGSQTMTVTLTAFGKGLNLGSTSILLGPNEKVIGTHDVWFPAVDVDDLQLIQATTSSPNLTGIALTGNQSVQLLVFTPAVLLN
ncbi:MAG: hypothetical protein V1793_16520 [Pseudomonadota bacterium]